MEWGGVIPRAGWCELGGRTIAVSRSLFVSRGRPLTIYIFGALSGVGVGYPSRELVRIWRSEERCAGSRGSIHVQPLP